MLCAARGILGVPSYKARPSKVFAMATSHFDLPAAVRRLLERPGIPISVVIEEPLLEKRVDLVCAVLGARSPFRRFINMDAVTWKDEYHVRLLTTSIPLRQAPADTKKELVIVADGIAPPSDAFVAHRVMNAAFWNNDVVFGAWQAALVPAWLAQNHTMWYANGEWQISNPGTTPQSQPPHKPAVSSPPCVDYFGLAAHGC